MSTIVQYMEMKRKYPECLLLFRCGDFYECYQEDAEDASKILGITLCRQRNKNEFTKVRMAGFPIHALDTYLPKLIRAGKKIAILEQLDKKEVVSKDNGYKFVPSYWEWHLLDDNGQIILNIPDPYDGNLIECKTYEDVLKLCEDWYLEAYKHYEDGEDFNGVKVDPTSIPSAYLAATEPVRVMAKTLYDYYIKSNGTDD